MHKKLAADLTSLAHSILQMKNKEDVFALKEKAHEVYEKLSLLAYVEEYINTTPNPENSKEELLEKIENAAQKEGEIEFEIEVEPEVEDEVRNEIEEVKEIENEVEVEVETTVEEVQSEIELAIEEVIETIVEEPKEKIEVQEEVQQEDKKVPTLEEELQDTIAVDVVADLFENAPKKSLNDKLQGDIQIGLNDRIAFVKNLFEGSQEDFNRVVSQLNTFKTEKEAKKFISKIVKPDYDWSEKEEFEERFMNIVERKFA